MYSIASLNGISVDTLIKDNALTNNTLKIGQVLKIRVSDGGNFLIEECFGEKYVPVTTNTYIVKKGDSLYSIAKKFNTTVQKLVDLNGLGNKTLMIGQVLSVPFSDNFYVVKSGDSLYSIAKKFNTSADNIKKKNNLTSNLLSIGQKLKI